MVHDPRPHFDNGAAAINDDAQHDLDLVHDRQVHDDDRPTVPVLMSHDDYRPSHQHHFPIAHDYDRRDHYDCYTDHYVDHDRGPDLIHYNDFHLPGDEHDPAEA